MTYLADPRFGAQASYAASESLDASSSETVEIERTRSVTLNEAGQVLPVARFEETASVNERVYRYVYDGEARTHTATTPEGRATTWTEDEQGLLSSFAWPGLAAWTGGADTNLYAYVYGDPVNLIDPTGEFAWIGAGAVIGAGVNVGITCFTNDNVTGRQLLAAAASGSIHVTQAALRTRRCGVASEAGWPNMPFPPGTSTRGRRRGRSGRVRCAVSSEPRMLGSTTVRFSRRQPSAVQQTFRLSTRSDCSGKPWSTYRSRFGAFSWGSWGGRRFLDCRSPSSIGCFVSAQTLRS